MLLFLDCVFFCFKEILNLLKLKYWKRYKLYLWKNLKGIYGNIECVNLYVYVMWIWWYNEFLVNGNKYFSIGVSKVYLLKFFNIVI